MQATVLPEGGAMDTSRSVGLDGGDKEEGDQTEREKQEDAVALGLALRHQIEYNMNVMNQQRKGELEEGRHFIEQINWDSKRMMHLMESEKARGKSSGWSVVFSGGGGRWCFLVLVVCFFFGVSCCLFLCVVVVFFLVHALTLFVPPPCIALLRPVSSDLKSAWDRDTHVKNVLKLRRKMLKKGGFVFRSKPPTPSNVDGGTGLADDEAYERRRTGNDGVPPRVPRQRSQVENEKRGMHTGRSGGGGGGTTRRRRRKKGATKMVKVNLTATQTAMVPQDMSVGYDMRSAR